MEQRILKGKGTLSEVFIIKKTKRGWLMGFWYLLLLLIGVVSIFIGFIKIKVAGAIKVGVMQVSFGVLLIVVSLLLLMPSSSEVIADLLNLQ